MRNDIYHLKLSTGDEIVGFVNGTTDDFITIEYPVSIERYKETGYQFSRWFPFSAKTKTHTINRLFVISASDLEESIKHNYIMYALSISKSMGNLGDIPYPDLDHETIAEESADDEIIH